MSQSCMLQFSIQHWAIHQVIVGYCCIMWRVLWQVQAVWAGGRYTGNLAVMAHGYIGVYPESDLLTKHYHLVELCEHFLQLCHLGRNGLCLVWPWGGDLYGATLAKEVLLLYGLDCYLVNWSVIYVGHWVSRGSLHQNCWIPNGNIQVCDIWTFEVSVLAAIWLWWVEL